MTKEEGDFLTTLKALAEHRLAVIETMRIDQAELMAVNTRLTTLYAERPSVMTPEGNAALHAMICALGRP